MNIKIPHNFKPRDYQKPLFNSIKKGYKRAYCIWHRRAGKDKTLINLMVKEAFKKKGVYYYFFPTYAQGKRILWDGIDGGGMKFLDHFPRGIIKQTHQNDMKIELINGSIFQIVGTDKYDAVRGTNPIGCIFSEYGFQNPMAWEVVRPILAQNKGWAIFNTTPNGKNHCYEMYEAVRDDENWFCEVLTVDDTSVVSEEDIHLERKAGMSEEMIQQEFYCSFDIGTRGSYYSDQMTQIREEERMTKIPFRRDLSVDVWFDLGINDMMSMWFVQREGEFYHFINYYEDNNQTLDYYAQYIDDYMQDKHGKLGTIVLPHDARKRDLITGSTPQQFFQKRYPNRVKVVEIGSVKEGIQKVRAVLPKCKFDIDRCKQGLRCLENYHREWDEVAKIFKDRPKHDWASHGSDSFRTGCMSDKPARPKPKQTVNYYDNIEKQMMA